MRKLYNQNIMNDQKALSAGEDEGGVL